MPGALYFSRRKGATPGKTVRKLDGGVRWGRLGFGAFLFVWTTLLGPQASRSENFANISLSVTLLDPFSALIQPLGLPLIYFRGYMKLPVDIDVKGNVHITRIILHYRPHGETNYIQAVDALAFRPDPAGSATYKGAAIIPGSSYIGGGVDYYIEVQLDNGRTEFSGTPDFPLFTAFSSEFQALVPESGAIVLLPDGDVTDGNTSITFPAGALSQSITLTIQSLDPAHPFLVPSGNGLAQPGAPLVVYDIDADIRRFAKPVTLTVLYNDVDPTPGTVDGTAVQETDLRLFWWDGSVWRLLGGVVDPNLNTVTAQTTHFSLFARFPVGRLSAHSFRPLEKIITPNGDGTNDIAFFAGLSGDFEIRIYDVAGREVRTIRDVAQWDGLDDDGKTVENGSYVYQYRPQLSNEWVSGVIGVAR
jgi:hypothetical protein